MGEKASERAARLEKEGLVPDGKWNRRVVRHPCGSLCIHEVHYDKDGKVRAWNVQETEAVDSQDGLAGLQDMVEGTYEQSMQAISRPILEWDELPHRPN